MAVNRELIAQAGLSAKMWGQEIHFHAEPHHRLLRARSFATDTPAVTYLFVLRWLTFFDYSCLSFFGVRYAHFLLNSNFRAARHRISSTWQMLFQTRFNSPSLCNTDIQILPLVVLDLVHDRLVLRETFNSFVVEFTALLARHSYLLCDYNAKWAIAQGYRADNPAGEAVTAALPKRPVQVRHIPALPHREVVGALAAVRASPAWVGTKLAFEFLVLLKKGTEWMVVHRPHPEPETGRATVRDMAVFLEAVGVKP